MENQSGLLPTPAGYTGFTVSSPTQTTSPSGDTSRSLYIGNLHPKITEPLLYEIFSTIGTVATCKIIRDKNGVSSGYGFIDYYDHPTANLAITHLNGRRVYGQEIKINWAHATGQKEDTTNHYHIFVGDLSPEIDDQALHNAFSAFGSISDARVMWDQNTGKSRGYGFVSFRQKADAEQALADMNGEWLGSRAIRCNWANQKVSTGSSDSGPMDFASVVSSTSSNNTTVYVGNLSGDVNEHVLRSVFLEYGYIDEIRIQNSNPDKAFGFIKYATHESAAKAIVHVNGKPIGSKMVKCSWGKEKGSDSSVGSSAPTPSPMVQPQMMATTPNYGYPQPYVYPQAYPPSGYYGAQPMYYPPGYYYPNSNTK